MARARRSADVAVSLFPFLSILACVIGTLTLVIAALALSQVVDDLDDADAGVNPHEQLQTVRGDLEKLEARIAQALETKRRLSATLAELEALGVPVEEPGFARRVSLQLDAARIAREIAALEREQKRLAAALEAAEQQFAAPAPESDSPPITILPSGPSRALKPYFVECRRDMIRLHRHDQEWNIPLQLGDSSDKWKYTRYLERARAEPDGTVIFLIRPDGVATYQRAVSQARKHFVRHAKLPLPGLGELDFSFF